MNDDYDEKGDGLTDEAVLEVGEVSEDEDEDEASPVVDSDEDDKWE